MPDGPRGRKGTASVPPNEPISTPPYNLPPGDSSYVEMVAEVQRSLGRLEQAVNSLTELTKEHGKDLKQMGMDLHAAKVTGKALLWVVGVVGAILGIILTGFVQQYFSHHK